MFEGQHPDEHVIFVIRQHGAILFRSLVFLASITVFPIAALIMFKFSWVFSYVFFTWLIIFGFYLLSIWYSYQKSQYILTTKRLINIGQKGFFHRSVSETALDRIQDVSFEVKGIWPSVWDYGVVYVQTAGTSERFVLNCVDEPRKVKDQITSLLKGIKKSGLSAEPEEESATADKPENQKKDEDFWN